MLKTTGVWTGLGGAPYFSTLFWAGTDSDDATDAINAHQAYFTVLAGLQTQALTGQVQPEVTSINPATGDAIQTYAKTAQAPVQGTGAQTPLPHANQALAQLRTGQFVGGRQVRGKVFLPGFMVNSMDTATGTMADVVRTQLATDLQAVFSTIPLLVWSRKSGVAYTVTSTSIAKQYAILRSRRD